MKAKSRLVQNWRTAGIGVALTVFAGLLFLTPVGEGLIHLSYELPFAFRPHTNVEEVVILYMDDESHKKLGQLENKHWNRSLHARTLERLTEWKARAVVFDVLFDERTTEEEDSLLLQAVRKHGNVIFGGVVEAEIFRGAEIGTRTDAPFSDELRWGIAETAGKEKIIRQHYRSPDVPYPSMAWVAVRATSTHPPTGPQEARWVNYYGPAKFLPHFSYYQVLSNAVPLAAISNKVVFIGGHPNVGYAAGVGTDDFHTPYTRWTGIKSQGVEVAATVYLNLFRGDWLTELPLPYELLLVLICALVFGSGLTRLRPMQGAVVAVCFVLAVSGAAIWIMWQTLLWFPWLVVAGVQIPAAFAWSVLAHTKRLQREKESLEIELAAARFQPPSSLEGYDHARPTVPARAHVSGPAQVGEAVTVRAEIGQRVSPDRAALPSIPDHTLIRSIGKGAYGEVWLARDVIKTFHAVKVVYRHDFKNATPFDREFRGIEKFTPISRSHAGFVNILHVGRNDAAGYFYYIMELGDDENSGQNIDPQKYEPRNLARILKRRGRLPAEECVQLALNLSSALEHLHQHQLIHRDIKPSNIIFVNAVPKFADIGLVTDIAGQGGDVSYLGTEGYIAPEGPGSAAADVYSLGAVLYEICTGLHPRRFPELPTSLLGDTAVAANLFPLNRIIVKACEREVRKRYQSAGDLYADLLQVQLAKAAK